MVLRWAPVALAFAASAAYCAIPGVWSDNPVTTATFFIWDAIALGIALTSRHSVLTAHVRQASLRGWTTLFLAFLAVAGLGVAGWIGVGWAVAFLAIFHASATAPNPRLTGSLAVLTILMVIVPAEGALLLLMNSPFLARINPLRNLAANIYLKSMNVVQYDQSCAQADAELGYILRPGACTFTNVEYSTRLDINHLGLRDDEASLIGPDMIVVGDSYAMGWGVEQDKTFASQIEVKTGWKVLNAGISSYATPRELALVKRLDLSKLRFFVLQYCGNDFDENQQFINQGYRSIQWTQSRYERLAKTYERNVPYYFGKYLFKSLSIALEEVGNSVSSEGNDGRGDSVKAYENMFDILKHSPVDLTKVPIIVLHLGKSKLRGHRGRMAAALEHAQESGLRGKVLIVDPAAVLEAEDYFVLDGHIRPSGHAKVAKLVLDQIARIP